MTRTAVAAAGFVSERGIKMNVYDFDNTIYDGESFLDLFFFFFKKFFRAWTELIFNHSFKRNFLIF